MNLGKVWTNSVLALSKVIGKRDPERLAARQRAQRKEGRDF